jgi:hypothetical protein
MLWYTTRFTEDWERMGHCNSTISRTLDHLRWQAAFVWTSWPLLRSSGCAVNFPTSAMNPQIFCSHDSACEPLACAGHGSAVAAGAICPYMQPKNPFRFCFFSFSNLFLILYLFSNAHPSLSRHALSHTETFLLTEMSTHVEYGHRRLLPHSKDRTLPLRSC